MLKRRLLAIAFALTSLWGASGALTRPAFGAVDVGAAEAQFLDLLNADRTAHGLQPLQLDSRLMDVARWRSEDMVARNFFGHDIGGFTIARILRERGIPFTLAGENIVSNTFDDATTVALAQEELMKSPSHRANVLRPEFNLVGVGIAVGANQRTVYTQVFIQGTPER